MDFDMIMETRKCTEDLSNYNWGSISWGNPIISKYDQLWNHYQLPTYSSDNYKGWWRQHHQEIRYHNCYKAMVSKSQYRTLRFAHSVVWCHAAVNCYKFFNWTMTNYISSCYRIIYYSFKWPPTLHNPIYINLTANREENCKLLI